MARKTAAKSLCGRRLPRWEKSAFRWPGSARAIYHVGHPATPTGIYARRILKGEKPISSLNTVVFSSAPNGQVERLVEQEAWRQRAFGVPGLYNVPHHLTNPGVDTKGEPVLLETSNFGAT